MRWWSRAAAAIRTGAPVAEPLLQRCTEVWRHLLHLWTAFTKEAHRVLCAIVQHDQFPALVAHIMPDKGDRHVTKDRGHRNTERGTDHYDFVALLFERN